VIVNGSNDQRVALYFIWTLVLSNEKMEYRGLPENTHHMIYLEGEHVVRNLDVILKGTLSQTSRQWILEVAELNTSGRVDLILSPLLLLSNMCLFCQSQ
jgi:hypothetical protein